MITYKQNTRQEKLSEKINFFLIALCKSCSFFKETFILSGAFRFFDWSWKEVCARITHKKRRPKTPFTTLILTHKKVKVRK